MGGYVSEFRILMLPQNGLFVLPSEVYCETKSRATFLIRLKKSVFLNNRGPEGRKPGSASTRFFWIISANILGAIHLIFPHQYSEAFALEEELNMEYRTPNTEHRNLLSPGRVFSLRCNGKNLSSALGENAQRGNHFYIQTF